MAEGNSIMIMVGAFIGVAIMLGIGIQILGGAVQNCDNLTGNSTSGWQGMCEKANTQTQTAYNLLIIILIVIAAVAILSVIRLL